jgi:hypothetical protein
MAAHWQGGSGGKGSRPRPFSVPLKTFDNNFEAIFGKKDKKSVEQSPKSNNNNDTNSTDTSSN